MTLFSCILFWSMVNQIDYRVTQAVISIESSGNPFALGSAREVGLMQIKPQYVPETALQLGQSCTNVMRGTAILRDMKKRCKHRLDKTYVTCYNLGITGARRIRHPKLQRYYKKITAKLEE